MKIYSIKYSYDPKIVGTSFNHLELDTSIKPYHVEWPNAYRKIPSEGKIPFDLAVSDFKVNQNAIQTDFMRAWMSSLKRPIISERFLKIIKQSEIGEHDIFPIRIINSRTDLRYFIFRFWDFNRTYVDWTRTTWVSYLQLPKAGEFEFLDRISVANSDDLKVKRKELRKKGRISLKLDKLYLKTDIDFDELFYLSLGSHLLCTEDFYRKINGVISGVEIELFCDTDL